MWETVSVYLIHILWILHTKSILDLNLLFSRTCTDAYMLVGSISYHTIIFCTQTEFCCHFQHHSLLSNCTVQTAPSPNAVFIISDTFQKNYVFILSYRLVTICTYSSHALFFPNNTELFYDTCIYLLSFNFIFPFVIKVDAPVCTWLLFGILFHLCILSFSTSLLGVHYKEINQTAIHEGYLCISNFVSVSHVW